MKNIFKNNISPFVLLGLIVFVLFFDFFMHGYVLDGNHDVREMEIPMHVYKLRAVQDMILPQWNPYIHCGTVFMGGGMDGLYYPPMFFVYLFPEKYLTSLITLLMVLHIYMAGAFAYLFFRRLVKDNFWALVAAVIYVLSGASIINMTAGNMCFSFLAYLPLWLYLIYTHEERGVIKNLFFTSLTLSLFFLIGMQQRVLYTIWFAFLFILFRPERLKILFTNILSLFVAFCVSAIRMLPFIENGRGKIMGLSSFDEALRYCYMPLESFLRFFSPEFFGAKLHKGFLFSEIVNLRANHLEVFSAYAGIAAAFISLYVLFFIKNKKLRFWKVAFVLIVLIIFVKPFNYIHYILSMKSQLLFGRLAWFLPICAAAMVGMFGVNFWEDRNKIKRLALFSLPVSAIIFMILLGLYNHYKVLGINPQVITAMRFSLKYYLVSSLIFIWVLLIPNRVTSKYLLLFFILADLFIIASIDSDNSLPFLSPSESFTHYNKIEKEAALKFKKSPIRRKFRIYSKSPWTSVNQCIKLGLYSSGGNDSFCSPYIARIYNRSYYLGDDRSAQAACRPFHIAAINLSSTAMVIYADSVKITRNPNFIPRVNLYSDYKVIEDDREAFRIILSPDNKPYETILLDRPPSLEIQESEHIGKTDVVIDENERVEIEAFLPVNSIMLLTDSYHKGWKAFIDGEETEIMRANYAFRAVAVPAGRHRVKFVFEHPALRVSVVTSIFGVFVLGGLGIVSYKKPVRQELLN